MLNSISSSHPSHAVIQPTAAAAPAPQAQTKGQAVAAPVDTVQISAAARSLQEATETPAQTAKEAAAGDIQAKHLLAKEAAAKSGA
jgi:hypothetical protein